MTVHNLFTLHFAFWNEKIAIQFHLQKLCKPDGSASESQKLVEKVMKL
jgi:hypothetical protein